LKNKKEDRELLNDIITFEWKYPISYLNLSIEDDLQYLSLYLSFADNCVNYYRQTINNNIFIYLYDFISFHKIIERTFLKHFGEELYIYLIKISTETQRFNILYFRYINY
jgi:hypothetical protein